MNLVYLAKPTYGGWVSFTAHLSLLTNAPVYKIRNRTERFTRSFAMDTSSRNIVINQLREIENIVITAVDKHHLDLIETIASWGRDDIYIVIHDPTELKPRLRDILCLFKVIVIRKTMKRILKEYDVESTWLPHPFYTWKRHEPTGDTSIGEGSAVSISRIDFDKNIDIILKANRKLLEKGISPIQLYGDQNELYVYHKLKELDFPDHYAGRFGKNKEAINIILSRADWVIDMSSIKGDGGGTQYTFLEAIHMGCALILNKKWVENLSEEECIWKDGYNCYIARNEEDIVNIISLADPKIVALRAREMLQSHSDAIPWKELFH